MFSYLHYRLMPLRRQWRTWLILLVIILSLTLLVQQIYGQTRPTDTIRQKADSGNPIDGFVVELNNETLFRVREGIPGVASAEERAQIIEQRLRAVADDPTIALEAIQVREEDDLSVVVAGETTVFTVRDNDAQVYGQSRQELANRALELIRAGVEQYREERSVRSLIFGIGNTVFSTLVMVIFLRLLFLFTSKSLTRVRMARRHHTLGMRIQNLQLLGSDSTSYLLSTLIRLCRLILILISFYIYIPFVLSQFPATKRIGENLLNDVAYRASLLVQAFAAYLPNLVIILAIILVTYYLIGFIKQIIAELGREDVYPWFYAEWVQPTTRLVTFLTIAIACVVAGPYLPGFGSPAFQGISLFLGALLTLGSSSAVANAVSGIILIYTRAFQIGDYIRIGEIVGEVKEKSLFVTRIISFKKEIITLPNLTVLNSNVTNYSAVSRETNDYLVLHTTITLGYDVLWREVHEVLINAAKATTYILTEPQPFVLQTSLNDFNVSYELNACTNHPQLIPKIYAELHQNIQDYCNEAGIEILSPTFSALRDGNDSTIPAPYLTKSKES
ncbi:MAG TPA: mechanosensitive ion channel family protein [Xenococcaceae cyanobacterium]